MSEGTPAPAPAPDAETEAALYDVAARQMAFKPGPVRNTMLDVAEQLLSDRIKWGDEFELTPGPNDRNCIGTAFKQLMSIGVVSRMNLHRRSKRKGQNGRTVWKYRLASEPLARLFMSRNGRTPHTRGQPEFTL